MSWVSAFVSSNKVDTERANWAIMSTNSAVIRVRACVGTVSNNTGSESHWVISTWVVFDVADVIWISDTDAVVATSRVNAGLVDGAIMEAKLALVVINASVEWGSRLFVAGVSNWAETSSGADLWWRNLQAEEFSLVGVDIVADFSFWDTVMSSLLAFVDVLASLLSSLFITKEVVGGHGVTISDETVLADTVVSSESIAGDADSVVVTFVITSGAIAVWIWLR